MFTFLKKFYIPNTLVPSSLNLIRNSRQRHYLDHSLTTKVGIFTISDKLIPQKKSMAGKKSLVRKPATLSIN